MTCDEAQLHLTVLEDGELTLDLMTEVQAHLASCPACAARRAELAAVAPMATAWAVNAPDVTSRVMQAITADDQGLLLDEMCQLRVEMQELRAEVAALRRHLPRPFDPYALPFAPTPGPARPDYARMEDDPWNLIRS